MPYIVQTANGYEYPIAEEADKFTIEFNVPMQGFCKITCQDGEVRWFNIDHVAYIGKGQ